MNIITIIKKVKNTVIKILKKLWQNLILLMIFFLVLDLIFGGIFFFKYYLLAKEKEPQVYIPLKINQTLMEKFSSEWQNREKIFKAAEEKEYPNPFQEIPSEKID